MSDPFLAKLEWALRDEKRNVVAVFLEEQLAHEAAKALTEISGVEYQVAMYVKRQLVRIDDRQFRFLSEDDFGRSIYCADSTPPRRMVITCCNGLIFNELQGQIVEVVYIRTSFNRDDVLKCPEYADKDFTRLTICNIAESGTEVKNLSAILQSAPPNH
ncbi:hypothetical protein ANRL1_00930 [Anaerolineae bacterium]|nr:hypothetical protein ANRL1_00930 [Anaerolineae bacterium]